MIHTKGGKEVRETNCGPDADRLSKCLSKFNN